MGDVFLTLLHMSLAASALVVVVVLLRLLLKRAPKAIHCALWAMVALRLLLPFSLESSFSLIPQDVAEGELLTEWQDDYVGEVTVIYDDSALYQEAVAAGREPFADGEGGYYVVTAPDRLDAPDTVETAVLPILGWVWLAGCAAMLLYAAVSFFRIRKRVQLSLPLRDNIWRCEAVDSPFILGFFRPNIYLPYDMDEGQAQYVIAHEEAHLRRRDHWWKPLGFLLLAVYWFNPLLWVAYILLCRDIELACDERVIRDMDASAKKAYSEALLSCSLPRHMVAACPLAFGEVGVKKRIASVLNYKKPAFWVLVVAILACVVVAVCFLTSPKDAIEGKVYTYEKSGVLGNFTIAFFEDGTFHYTEGMASSYLATGKWTEKGNILTLTDDENLGYKLVNRFRKDGDTLYFIAEGSSNFLYVTVQDGERFTYTFDIEQPILDGVDGMQTTLVPGYSIVDGALTEEELASLNELLAPVVYDKQGGIIGASPWSCFFTSYYRDVRALDFEKFMRYFPGDGSTASAEEFELLKGTEGWPFSQEDTLDTIPVPIHKYPARLVDAILLEYAGITTAEVDTSGVAYLEEYDAYYNYTSDFGAASFHCTSGERVGDILYLYSDTGEGTTRLTLREAGNSYHILALQPVVTGEAVAGEFATVAALFDTLLSSPADATKAGDYIKAHPNEHIALLSDENLTLRYIFTEFLKGDQPEPKGQVMRLILDQLAPEAQLRLHTETGQEYFDEWIKGADRVATDHGLEWMQHNQPYMYMALQLRSDIYGHSFPMIPVSQSELENAVWFTPEDIHDIEYVELVYADGQRFTLSSEEGYAFVESFLSSATEAMIPACPFDNILFLHRADGTVGKILTASDGCWMIKSNEKYYRVADWDDPAYQSNKEKYFSSFVPLGDRALTDTYKLPTVTNAEGEKQQAACDAILASLSTGWWLGGRTLDPAKEAAAFICFHQHFVGDEVNLYGFGGYFSQDAQGNDDLSWCDFTIVTLNASTLDLISVWWPGDGAYHDMSIEENFIDYLVEPILMISTDDYQRLQTALRKQAAENMVDAGLSLPDAQTRIFKRDGLELEVSGVRAVRQMNMVAEGIALHEYAVFVCDPNATITVRNADMSDPAYSEDGLPHPNWGLLYEDDTRVRITEETGTVPITPDLQCVYHLDASLSVLDFEIVE